MKKVSGEHRFWAAVAYILFFVPLLVEDVRKSPFVKFHIRQGLGLFISFFVLRLVSGFLFFSLFFVMGFMAGLVHLVAGIAMIVVLIMGIVGAAKGEKKKLPIIGDWADRVLRI